MKRVTFTLVYILLFSIAANIHNVQSTTKSSPVIVSPDTHTESPKKGQTLPIVLTSGPVHTFPEPATFSLFGFGFLLIIGFGWIKKAPEHELIHLFFCYL